MEWETFWAEASHKYHWFLLLLLRLLRLRLWLLGLGLWLLSRLLLGSTLNLMMLLIAALTDIIITGVITCQIP